MIDAGELLKPLSDEAPCGEDLEYDPQFGAMERASQGKPEQQYGGTVVPAEDPNWAEVRSNAVDLLKRTRDLRVGVLLTRGVLPAGGFVDFSQMLGVLRGWIEQYWEPLYPRLDPDDGLDPTIRVNLLASLCDPSTLLSELKKTPLVASRLVGRFGLRDLAIARGEVPAPAGMSSPPTTATIDAAFQDAAIDDLQQTCQALQAACEHVTALESAVTAQVGTGRAISLAPLASILNSAHTVLTEQLTRRGVSATTPEADGEATTSDGETEGSAMAAAKQPLTGEISTREDVVKAIDKICEYYAKHEPSSPLPLLLNRARRLTSMTFMEILQDLAPDAVAQAQSIGGTVPE